MPREIPGTGGFKSYGADKSTAPPPQKEFPKSQGGVAPPSPKREVPGTDGFTSYGGPKAVAPAEQSSGNSLLYDMFHPQAADLNRPQTWHDWLTRTYNPSAKQVGTAALDDVSFGYADPIQAHFSGENAADIRARTADAQAALGPGGVILNAGTYAVPGMGVARGLKAVGQAGKVAGALGRYGAGALEGATANATSSVGHQIGDPNKAIDPWRVGVDTAIGAGFGLGGQAAGDAAAAATRRVSNYVRGSPGRSGEQWNWRERAKAGDPTFPDEVALQRGIFPPDDPAQPALAKTQEALNQSIEPGAGFNTVAAATAAGATGLGINEGMHWAKLIVPGGVAGLISERMGKPLARSVNRLDRNINVGQAMDQLYPALYGPQKNPALDTSGWADVIRQGTIGGERPTDAARDAQWW